MPAHGQHSHATTRAAGSAPCRVRRCIAWLVALVALAAAPRALATTTTSPALAAALASPLDYDALTWGQWTELHDAAAAAMALERVYKHSPRVRVKVRIAAQLAMNEYLTGDAIFRQQLSEVAGVAAARVQLEFLQTSALRATDRDTYTVAFGISALPDPQTADNATTLTLQDAIERERMHIMDNVRSGRTVRGQNATIASLTLFGSAGAELVDIALDGETFYPINLKPWLAARLAVVPATEPATSTSTIELLQERYLPARDALQNLRLRFLVASILRPLQIETSDILVREAAIAPPFAPYYSHAASIVDVEVHVSDERFRTAVDGYLRSPELARAFRAAEPQWMLAAINIAPDSGILYAPPPSLSPPTPAAASTTTATSSTVELTFQLDGVSFVHLDSRKSRVFDHIAALVASANCSSCHARFARIALPSGTETLRTATHNDGDDSESAALDPINMRSTMLVVAVDVVQSAHEPAFRANLSSQVTLGDSTTDLCLRLGAVEASEPATATTFTTTSPLCTLASIASVSSTMATSRTPPFVGLALTLAPGVVNAPIPADELAANVFVHHRARCALLVLLQQVAVVDADDVQLDSAAVAPTASLTPGLVLHYRIAVRDESQRRGIAQHVLSKRFERTLAAYMNQLVSIHERSVDEHADGSPRRDDELPGLAYSLASSLSA